MDRVLLFVFSFSVGFLPWQIVGYFTKQLPWRDYMTERYGSTPRKSWWHVIHNYKIEDI